MLNKDFVQRKVGLIQRDVERLGELSKFSLDEIFSDYSKANTLERLLEKIINRAIDINQHIISKLAKGSEKVVSYEDTFHLLSDLGVYPKSFGQKIAPSAGLRNRLVHEYDDLDEKILYSSISKEVKQYIRYCRYVLDFLKKKNKQ